MSDFDPPPPRGCLTVAEMAQVRACTPGEVPERLARHLAACERCQERVLFGSARRRRRRVPSDLVMPTSRRAFIFLGILLLVVIVFFFILNTLVGRPAGPPPAHALPSTGSRAPVTGVESADRRNAMTRAIAAGEVQLERSASGMALRLAGVSIVPGSTLLNRTPRSRFSAASTRVSAWTADFETA